MIEIVRLQLKMGELLARTNDRVNRLEAIAQFLLEGEPLEKFKKLSEQSSIEMAATDDALKEQVRVTLDALERHMNE